MDIARLKEKVERIEDPRRAWGNLRHKLEAILVIGLAALVCNGSDFEDRESFGVYREAELKKFLELPNGIPDESTDGHCRRDTEVPGGLYSGGPRQPANSA
jgi:hypothetical protein